MPTEQDATQFGRYEVIRRIARGGMGELYLARSSGTGGWEKQVAIKTILPHLNEHAESIKRFADEARIATTLTHGNIVQVFDFDQTDDGTYFIAMEYVEGWDLRWLLKTTHKQQKTISQPLAIFITAGICCGLQYAHERTDTHGQPLHIVHRDISPSNILISSNGEVKITDFGIAAARNRFERTITGELRGKFGYMSPEQALGGSVDYRSDIFSSGIALFQMLTGERPFQGGSDMEILNRVQHGKRPRVRELLPHIDEELEEIVERALAYNPEDRFQSSEEMQVALLGLLYRDTQPVTNKLLAGFCQSLDDSPTEKKLPDKQASSPGFDTLLQQQLEGHNHRAEPSAPSSYTPARYSSGSLPAMGPSTGSFHTQTIDPLTQRKRRRKRRRWQIIGGIGLALVAAIAIVGSYLAGQRGSILPTVLRVETKPPGARVSLDGTPYGRTTLIERIKPGVHIVQISNDGYKPVQRTVHAEPSQLTRVAMHLEPTDAQESAQTYTTVQFFIEPSDGTVQIGEDTIQDGETLVVPVGIPKTLVFTSDGYKPLSIEHTFVEGEDRFVRRLTPTEETKEEQAKELQQRASTTKPSYKTVQLSGIPSGGTVKLNGRSYGTTRQLKLPPSGQIRLEVQAPGYQTFEQSFTSGDWSDGALSVSMEALGRGWLTVRFVGDVMRGNISIDGRNLGENRNSTRARFELTQGVHRLFIENQATGHTFEQSVDVQGDSEEVVTVDWQLQP